MLRLGYKSYLLLRRLPCKSYLVLVQEASPKQWIDDGDVTFLNGHHFGKCFVGNASAVNI